MNYTMDDLPGNLEDLKLDESVFKDVKFYISGYVSEKVLEVLRLGGAERMNYFSDYVTHLVCGIEPDENDITDAIDVYEIPIVTVRWIITCAKLKKKINLKGFRYDTNKLFSGMKFCFSKIGDDKNVLWSIISYNGGVVLHNLTSECTHLVTCDLKTSKYIKAFSLHDKIKIITIDWILESIKNKSLAQYELYHPKLLTWPKPRESTALITGFEQDDTEKVSDIPETDSTQALLDQLKQRMPWNQPPAPTTTTSSSFQNFLNPTPELSAAKRLPWTPPSTVTSNASTNNNSSFNFNNSVTSNADNKRLPWNQSNLTSSQPPPPPFPTPPNSQQELSVKSNLFSGINDNHSEQNQQQVQQQQQVVQQQQQQLFQQQRVQQIRTSLAQQSQQFLNSKPNVTAQNTFNQQIPQQQQIQQIQTMQGTINQQGPVQPSRQFLGQNQQHIVPNTTQQTQYKIGQPSVQNVQGHLGGQQAGHVTQINPQTGNQIMVSTQQQMIHSQPQLVQNQLNQTRMTQPQAQISFQNQVVANQQVQQVQFNVQQQVQQIQQVQQQVPFGPRGPVIQEQIPFTNQNQIQMNQMGQNQIFQQQTPQNQVPHQFLQQKVQQRPQLHPTWQQQQQQQLNPQLAQQQQINPQLAQQQQINPQQINTQQINAAQQLQQQQRQQLAAQQQLGPQPHLVQQQITQQQLNQQQLLQQQQQQQQLGVQRHPNAIGAPRLNWSPNQPQGTMPQRQLIHLDAQTHQQLQQMDPQQRALFVQKLQKQRQLMLQQRQQQIMHQQRGGHIAVIRSAMPPGLSPQQQMQWLQQQQQQQQQVAAAAAVAGGKPPQVVLPPGHAPGLSPIAQTGPVTAPGQVVVDQNQQIQRQQFQRLQQLQMQREQAQKQQQLQQQQAQQQAQQQVTPNPAPLAPRPAVLTGQETGVVATVTDAAATPAQQQLVVNAKTKTALANMLSIRLQSGSTNIPPGTGPEQEPSAAGTLRLMNAQHNASLNPPARPQDLLALQQPRRTLGNITNASGIPTPAVATVTDTVAAKQFPPATPGPPGPPPPPGRVLAPQQHRHGPFYGHNPNLKLPPDLFLLGCIFVVVEVERYLEEHSPDWRAVVERHGGEIEAVYCSRVTHVICETQRHGVVMQALRDFKRCITLFWLDDVVKRRQVLPPWQALHLPTGYMDGAPASRHLISLSGFVGNDRFRVRDMIKYTGAKYTSYFSRHNTLLICVRAEGFKWQHAKKWGTPVVSVQWLTDLMLGNLAALQQIEHAKYQQFAAPGQPVQFGFDAALVPNLMFAWKMPINISQEYYERVKRSPPTPPITPKAKKPKLESQPIKIEESDTLAPTSENSTSHRVLFSLFSEKDRINLENIVTKLGGSVAKSLAEATHLVMPKLTRTFKLLHAIIAGVQIIPDTWLVDSNSEKKLLDSVNYKFDAKEFNSKHSCDFYATLQVQNRDKLFINKIFYLTPSVAPTYKQLKQLIELGGGLIEKQRRALPQIESANNSVPYSYVMITAENDLHLVYDCLRKGDKTKIVCSSELVLNAILNQKLCFESYLVRCC